MSASFLTRRIAIILVALAVLTAASARGAQSSAAKSHRKSTNIAGLHAMYRRAASPAVHRTTAPSHLSLSRKPTPEEVGHSAGLAIRSAHARTIHTSAPVQRSRSIADDYASRAQQSKLAPVSLASPAVTTENRGTAEEANIQSAPREQAAAVPDVAAFRQSGPERDADFRNPGSGGDAESDDAENDLDQPSKLPQALRASDGAAGSEEASLVIPRGVMPAPLRGSLASLERQNDRLEAEGLERIEDEKDLAARIANKLLVPVPASAALTVNAELPENHRYCRPWTAQFLAELARAHETVFHRPIEVNSAVRTVEYQKRLMNTNGNAAAAEGDVVSPHLTGSTVDIAKEGLTRDEMAWMRRRLLALEDAGKIDVEEEFQQACFHITVYKSYAPAEAPYPAAQPKSGTGKSRRGKAPAPAVAEAQRL